MTCSFTYCRKKQSGALLQTIYRRKYKRKQHCINGTARFKNVNNCLNTNIYSYFEISGGQSSNLYLNVVNFYNTSVN